MIIKDNINGRLCMRADIGVALRALIWARLQNRPESGIKPDGCQPPERDILFDSRDAFA